MKNIVINCLHYFVDLLAIKLKENIRFIFLIGNANDLSISFELYKIPKNHPFWIGKHTDFEKKRLYMTKKSHTQYLVSFFLHRNKIWYKWSTLDAFIHSSELPPSSSNVVTCPMNLYYDLLLQTFDDVFKLFSFYIKKDDKCQAYGRKKHVFCINLPLFREID